MSTATINRTYDSEADVMYISLGRPKPALTKPLRECDAVLVRYDMNSKEVVGATIYSYSQFDKNYLESIIPIQHLKLQ